MAPRKVFDLTNFESLGVSKQIVATLTGMAGPIKRATTERARRKSPTSLEAYDYLLLSVEGFTRQGRENVLEARRLAEQAIARDPSYALARAGLAQASVSMIEPGYLDGGEGFPVLGRYSAAVYHYRFTVYSPLVDCTSH